MYNVIQNEVRLLIRKMHHVLRYIARQMEVLSTKEGIKISIYYRL